MKLFSQGRKVILSVLFLFFSTLCGVIAQPHNIGQPDTRFLSQEGATEALNNFRRQRIVGDYAMRFILEKTDLKGKKTSLFGSMWGGWREGNVVRLEVPKQKEFNGLELLVYGGQDAKAWMITGDGSIEKLDEKKYATPIVDEFVFTPFHILMPFIYWNDATYTGGAKVKGRNVQKFELRPPKDYSADVSMIRIYLDDVYNALIKAEIFDKAGTMQTELTVSTIKKVQDQWIAKTIDLIDAKKKDKLRLIVKEAALNLDIENSIFEPEGLKKLYPKVPQNVFSDMD